MNHRSKFENGVGGKGVSSSSTGDVALKKIGSVTPPSWATTTKTNTAVSTPMQPLLKTKTPTTAASSSSSSSSTPSWVKDKKDAASSIADLKTSPAAAGISKFGSSNSNNGGAVAAASVKKPAVGKLDVASKFNGAASSSSSNNNNSDHAAGKPFKKPVAVTSTATSASEPPSWKKKTGTEEKTTSSSSSSPAFAVNKLKKTATTESTSSTTTTTKKTPKTDTAAALKKTTSSEKKKATKAEQDDSSNHESEVGTPAAISKKTKSMLAVEKNVETEVVDKKKPSSKSKVNKVSSRDDDDDAITSSPSTTKASKKKVNASAVAQPGVVSSKLSSTPSSPGKSPKSNKNKVKLGAGGIAGASSSNSNSPLKPKKLKMGSSPFATASAASPSVSSKTAKKNSYAPAGGSGIKKVATVATTTSSLSKKHGNNKSSSSSPLPKGPIVAKEAPWLKKGSNDSGSDDTEDVVATATMAIVPAREPSTAFEKHVAEQVKLLQEYGNVIATTDLSPRDNDLVTAMTRVAACDCTVDTLHVVQDVRFAHASKSLVLDMADGMRLNCYVVSMTLQHVTLGNAFLSALGESMKTNCTLQTLDLRHNVFTCDALTDFSLSALRHNCGSLKSVDLRHQNSPIFSQYQDDIIAALDSNEYIQAFHVEFREDEECQKRVQKILARNKSMNKSPFSSPSDREDRVKKYLAAEVADAAEAYKNRTVEQDEAGREIDESEYEYFYELAELAKVYKVDLTKATDGNEEGGNDKPSSGPQNFLPSAISRSPSNDLGTVIPKENMTADGAFLTPAFFDTYLKPHPDHPEKFIFEFTNQFRLFKRFAPDDPARSLIVTKFVDVLLDHPKQADICAMHMANTCIADDFLKYFCERVLTENKLPGLHQLNLETNLLDGPGIMALAKCIQSMDVWTHLTVVKLDNQRALVKTSAETALAVALSTNRSVIRLSLRVRNMAERDRINKYLVRNIDYLRQARHWHNVKTGKVVQRARNRVEKLFDQVAANDESVTTIQLIGDGIFLALNEVETLKAASSFANNTHVTTVKMNLLKLNDKFGVALGEALLNNNVIEQLELESNSLTGEGILAVLRSLATNQTCHDVQLRHQSKPMATVDEEQIASILEPNETIIKLGVDLRSQLARSEVDRFLRRNQEKRRQARANSNHKKAE